MKTFLPSHRGAFFLASCVFLLSGPTWIGGLETPASTPSAASPDKAGTEWVTVPGGSFTMGDKGDVSDAVPAHPVNVRTFQMARTLVTNKQYRACVQAGACSPIRIQSPATRDDQPVLNVTWDQARAYSAWVGGRLPTEAEWEFAARSGGKERAYPWGDEPATCDRAVFDDGERGCGRKAPWPVCSKAKGNTEQGLCDMSGNATQWVEDSYHASYAGAPADGAAWEDAADARRVLRGGAWCSNAGGVAVTTRLGREPQDTYQGAGFRPARF